MQVASVMIFKGYASTKHSTTLFVVEVCTMNRYLFGHVTHTEPDLDRPQTGKG